MTMEKMMNMEETTKVSEMQEEWRTYTSQEEWNIARTHSGRVKSQKARALFKYSTLGKSYAGYRIPKTLYVLVDDDPWEVVKWCESTISVDTDIFVRTCPLTPRHGVLESTRCVNHKNAIATEVQRLQAIMLEHDPEGCLMVQPYEPAFASCVLAPDMYVVFGEGHDGVTAGTNYSDEGTSLMFPLSQYGRVFSKALASMSTMDDVYDSAKHEIEMVFKDAYSDNMLVDEASIVEERNGSDNYLGHVKSVLTQVRGCDEHIQVGTPPEGVDISGAIPDGDVEVTKTVVMTGLEKVQWLEENITKDLCPKGFVVVEPNGSLLSHIAAHCRTHGVPYIIADESEVCVGDTWTEVASGWVVQNNDGDFVANPYNPWQHIGAFRDGVRYGNKHWRRKQSALSTFFHQWMGQPCNDPQLTAFLGGVFCAWLVKATIAATVGEMRHARDQKSNWLLHNKVAVNSYLGNGTWEGKSPYNIPQHRTPYHTWMERTYVDWEDAARLLQHMASEYATGWSSAYGGPKWGDGAEKGARVATLIDQLMQASADELEDVGKGLVEAVNALENAQHNNGGLLNKFGSETMTHFTGGTLGYEEGQMQYVFQSYMIAMDVVNDRIPCEADHCSQDWTAIADFFQSKQPKYWRICPLLQHTDAPEDVQVMIDAYAGGFHHAINTFHKSNGHQFNDHTSKSFVPCGHPNCGKCNNHYTHMSMISKPSPTVANGNDVWLLGAVEVAESQFAQAMKATPYHNPVDDFKHLMPTHYPSLAKLIEHACDFIQQDKWPFVVHLFTPHLITLEGGQFVQAMEAIEDALKKHKTAKGVEELFQ